MTDPLKARFLDRTTPPHIATLIAMAGVAAMSMNMFLPSLPSMAAYFDTEYRVMQLSVALFLAVNGVMQLVVGPLSDRYGRRPMLLAGFSAFMVATAGCLLAPTVEVFLVFRMLQATSVVGMVLSRAMIRDVYPQDQAASVLGYTTMGMAVVPMVAPMIGGYLDDTFGWQAVFYLYLVVGAATIWLIRIDVGETHHSRSTSLREQIAQYPELFSSPRFWGYALAAAFSAGTFFSYLGGAPFIGSEIFGLNPTVLGLMFGAPALGYIVGNFLTGRFSERIGVNRMILVGSVACSATVALSLAIFLSGAGSAASFFGLMTFVGLGNGLVLPNAIAGTLSVRPHLAGTASGLGGALMIGGGAALSALAGWLLGPGSGPYPLLWIQLTVSLLGIAVILMVIRREGRLRMAGAA